VRPRAADPGDQALVAEERVQAARLLGADLAQPPRAQAERLRAEVSELLLGRLGRQEPDACALLRPRLGEDEARAALEDELEGRLLWPSLAEAQEAEPPGGHEVDEQDELAVVGREEEALGAPARTREAAALEGGQRR